MSRKQDSRYTSRPRSLTTHFGSSPNFSSTFGSSYSNPYLNNYSNTYSPNSYRNYNPYSRGLGRTSSNLGIYGGTSSGYGGVYLSGALLGSLNLMSPVLKNLDKKILASQKKFKPKEVIPTEAVKEVASYEAPPVRPERKSRSMNRSHSFNKERSRSLSSLAPAETLSSRSISLTSLASDGYYVCYFFLMS